MTTTVAAFDFDGTLTYKDTLIPFLIFSLGRKQALLHLARSIPNVVAFSFGWQSRQEVKEALLMRAFAGWSESDLMQKGIQFAEIKIAPLLNPVAIKKLRWHQNQKHRCILISATLSTYLAPWAKMMGFDDLICSQLATASGNMLLGKLAGPNCWGAEKSRRLQAMLKDTNYTLYAYGDSAGDKELLELAHYPFYRSF